MSDFETLLKKNNICYNDRWKPYFVDDFEVCFKQGKFSDMNRELRKNIVYSLQYLEYLQLQFLEVKLHDIIKSLLYKSYIVTSMGIIEGIFYFLLKSNNLYRKENWEQVGESIHTNQFKENGILKKYTITKYQKLETAKDGEMDFESIINKVQDKKLINLSGKAFPYIKHLKRIRNKVHLQINRYKNDTDYLTINEYDYLLTRYILYKILTDPIFNFDAEPTCYKFIDLNAEELSKLEKHMSNRQTEKENN